MINGGATNGQDINKDEHWMLSHKSHQKSKKAKDTSDAHIAWLK